MDLTPQDLNVPSTALMSHAAIRSGCPPLARSGAAQLCLSPLDEDNVVPLRLAQRFDNRSRRGIADAVPRLSREMSLQFVRPEPVAMPREYFIARDAQCERWPGTASIRR